MAKRTSRSGDLRRGTQRRAQRRIAMHGAMTIYEAVDQKRTLLGALAECEDLEIDLSGVSEMDTAGIQLLLLAKREAAKSAKRLRLTAHSAASLEAIDLYDLGSYFGDPVVISSRKRRLAQRSNPERRPQGTED
jgi:ABC-type transporter Mla MlaB component